MAQADGAAQAGLSRDFEETDGAGKGLDTLLKDSRGEFQPNYIQRVDPLRGRVLGSLDRYSIYPGSHYVTPRQQLNRAITNIRDELNQRLEEQVMRMPEMGVGALQLRLQGLAQQAAQEARPAGSPEGEQGKVIWSMSH